MESLYRRTGQDVLQEAGTLVIKCGGENAVQFDENFRSIERRLEDGQNVAFVPSALRGARNGGFNTTSQLIHIATNLQNHDVSGALNLAKSIERWTQSAVQAEIKQDSTLESVLSQKLISQLSDCIREEVKELERHVQSHKEAELHSLDQDWVLQNGEYFSITGWGEHLSQVLYAEYCKIRGVACASLQTQSAARQWYGERPRDVLECQLKHAEQVDALRQYIRIQLEAFSSAGSKLIIGSAYSPLLAMSRGYSDTGAAIFAHAAQNYSEDGSVACLIRKSSPVLEEDPAQTSTDRPAKVIQHLTYARAKEIMAPNGSAAGVVHLDALGILENGRIPTVVCSPAHEDTDWTTLIY